MVPAFSTDYAILGESLALDFVNTFRTRRLGTIEDMLTSEEQLADWLARLEGRAPALGPHELAGRLTDFRRLRASTRAVINCSLQHVEPPPAAIEVLNARAARSTGHLELGYDRRPVARYRSGAADDPVDTLLSQLAVTSIETVAGPDRDRLRLCPGPGCILFFLQTRENRRWCSPDLCGNRVRVTRHYRKLHPSAGALERGPRPRRSG